MGNYSRRQIITLVVFSVCQFCTALCFSIQAPFYPAEAESKGATASEYGFVFGIYELVIFLVSPIYGRFIKTIGVKLVNNCGLLTVAVSCLLFGLMDKMEGKNTFLGFSFAIRIIEANGAAAFVTAAFSIIAKEFPENVGSAFATIETFFGLGLIAGPTVGGALYQVGGFMFPFLVVGCLILLASLIVFCFLPKQDDDIQESKKSKKMLFSILKLPCVILGIATVISASISIGFLQSTLEPHLRPLHLTPLQMGFIFVLNGGAYALCAPFWGMLSDKYIQPRIVCMIGCIGVAIAFLLIGPAPFMPFGQSLPLLIASLIIHGLGFGAELVPSFSGMNRDVIEEGFPASEAYGIVSGLWNSAFALGCFIGPSVAGVLFDVIGFGYATLLVFGLHALLFMLTLTYVCSKRVRKEILPTIEEQQPLIPTEDERTTSNSVVIIRKLPSFGSSTSFRDFIIK